MTHEPVAAMVKIAAEPARVAGRAVTAWDWYYFFIEARLVEGQVADH